MKAGYVRCRWESLWHYSCSFFTRLRSALTCLLRLPENDHGFEQTFQSVDTRMIQRVITKYVALVIFFTFCQVMGSMCTLPDLSMAEEVTTMVEEHMACPMDGTIMCPPLLTSSPERQLRQSIVAMDVAHATILLSPAAVPTLFATPTHCSWSNVCSIVPLSIDCSSVLRI